MTTTITPSLGNAPLFTQTGASIGYDGIDLRRFLSVDRQEGPLSYAGYRVTQRAAGANLSIDIAASSAGALVAGDSVVEQGLYYVPPHGSPINEVIAPADAINPRNDLVVLEVLDDTHASGGLNASRVRVITGTPNGSATRGDFYGVNGTPALPASSIPLAVVNVPATDTTISDSQISNRRPGAPSSNVASENCTSTSFTTFPNPDIVHGVVVPDLPRVSVMAEFGWSGGTSPEIAVSVRTNGGAWSVLYNAGASTAEAALSQGIFVEPAAAGTYDVSLQAKVASGSLGVSVRKLWARAVR